MQSQVGKVAGFVESCDVLNMETGSTGGLTSATLTQTDAVYTHTHTSFVIGK